MVPIHMFYFSDRDFGDRFFCKTRDERELFFMTKPAWLRVPSDVTGRAADAWKHHAGALFRAGALVPEKVELFKSLCRMLALKAAAAADIEANGVVIGTDTGTRKSNPAVATLLAAEKACEPLLREFDLA